ncbi:MAG: mechanosensitive ion channel family protein [Candidatus Woesearchaeota archaeon]
MNLQELQANFIESLIEYIPQVVIALLVFFGGLLVSKYIVLSIGKIMSKRKVDQTISKFSVSLISVSLKIVLIIIVISILGVQTTSIIAFLGALGFAVGLALQGGLSNFAGGILILFFKPFKVGDFILANGNMGTVEAIQIFNTTIKTPDGIFMYIPNGALSNTAITNFSRHKTRRIDLTIGISYDDDISKAKKVLQKILSTDKRILSEPEYSIVVCELNDNSVDLKVRAWVQGADWWPTQTDLLEVIKNTFDKNNITIPYPQRDIHMKK